MKLLTLCLMILSLLTGCTLGGGLPQGAAPSEVILLSVYFPGAGYGTRAMCAGAEVYVYTDGTIHIEMPDITMENNVEIAVIPMLPEHYADLAAFATPEKIARLRVKESWDVCDGNSQYITLYTDGEEGPAVLLKKGGYMVQGKAFGDMYRGIWERLAPYQVREKIDAWRQKLMDAEE